MLGIRGRYLSASALVIGAMIPDLPLYAPVGVGVDLTHTAAASVTVNLALGFALFVIWHGFVARPADWFAPSSIRRRLSPQQQPGLRRRLNSPRKVAGVVASLLIGQATHFFLDLFTHSGTVVTANIAVFNTVVMGAPVYYWAQVGLSVLGLAVLGWWALRWLRSSPTYPLHREPSPLGKIAVRGTVLGAGAAAIVLSAAAAGPAAVASMSIAAVVAAAAATLLVAALWHLRNS